MTVLRSLCAAAASFAALGVITAAPAKAQGQIVLPQADLSVPESPAFTVLNVTPENVARPGTPRKLATTLLNGLDRNGNLQNGLAIDFSPFTFAPKTGEALDLNRYRRNTFLRLLSNTQLSLATAKGQSDEDSAVRLALGFQTTVYDSADPRQNSALIDALVALDPGADDLEKQVRDTFKRYQRRSSRLLFAAAPVWISESGNTEDLRLSGYGVWASYGYGYETTDQFIVHVRYRSGEDVPDEDNEGAFLRQNSALIGLRYRKGWESNAVSFEAAYTSEKMQSRPTDEFTRLSIAFEQRIDSDLWLGILAGTEAGRENGDRLRFAASFKWGTATRRQLVQQ